MGRVDWGAGGVVGVPGPVRTAGQADRVDTEEVGGGLDPRSRPYRIERPARGNRSVLQQYERTEAALLRAFEREFDTDPIRSGDE